MVCDGKLVSVRLCMSLCVVLYLLGDKCYWLYLVGVYFSVDNKFLKSDVFWCM